MPEITLENLKVGLSKLVLDADVRARLGSYSEARTTFDVYKEKAEEMRWSLNTSVLAGRAVSDTRTFVLRYPATWWQHLKRDGRPRWLLRRIMHRRPVRMTEVSVTVDFTSYDTFPRADVPVPLNDSFGYSVRWDEDGYLATAPVTVRDSGISRSREFVDPRHLHRHLLNRVMGQATVHLSTQAASEVISNLIGAWDPTGGRGILGELGVNTAQLVRRGRLEEDERERG